jgi:hypothetical protein
MTYKELMSGPMVVLYRANKVCRGAHRVTERAKGSLGLAHVAVSMPSEAQQLRTIAQPQAPSVVRLGS